MARTAGLPYQAMRSRLVRGSGITHEGQRAFVRDAYQLMIHEVMEAMCRGIAA